MIWQWSRVTAQGKGNPGVSLAHWGALQWVISEDTALPLPPGDTGACAELVICSLLHSRTFEKCVMFFAHFAEPSNLNEGW